MFRIPQLAKVSLGQMAGGGGVGAVLNPTGQLVVITRLIVLITSPQTSQTLDVGVVGAANSSADNLIDGLATDGAGSFDNIVNKGTNGRELRRWFPTQWITLSASGTPSDLAGSALIEYVYP